jgi:hypothetical protein
MLLFGNVIFNGLKIPFEQAPVSSVNPVSHTHRSPTQCELAVVQAFAEQSPPRSKNTDFNINLLYYYSAIFIIWLIQGSQW